MKTEFKHEEAFCDIRFKSVNDEKKIISIFNTEDLPVDIKINLKGEDFVMIHEKRKPNTEKKFVVDELVFVKIPGWYIDKLVKEQVKRVKKNFKAQAKRFTKKGLSEFKREQRTKYESKLTVHKLRYEDIQNMEGFQI